VRLYERAREHPGAPLIAVAVLYGIAQFMAVTTRMRLGWDETVYLSQVDPRIPAAYFGAPRARGITLLPAPALTATASLGTLRAYLTVLSSAGLAVAYWPWTRLLRPATAGLAALLFAALWMVQFYGNEVMPNLYVGYGAVAAAGWLAHTLRGGSRRAPIWLALSVAFVALMRPGDALWLALPLAAATIATHGRRLPDTTENTPARRHLPALGAIAARLTGRRRLPVPGAPAAQPTNRRRLPRLGPFTTRLSGLRRLLTLHVPAARPTIQRHLPVPGAPAAQPTNRPRLPAPGPLTDRPTHRRRLPVLGPLAARLSGRRRLLVLGAIAGGLGAGSGEWIAEAYARFGGPLRRLHASSRTEGGLGWHPEGVRMELHALNQNLLCRPCGGATWHVAPLSLWWPVVPVLAVAGLVVAARAGRPWLLALPALCGAVLGASYLLLVGYAAPRFLIPAYALLALPVAEFLVSVAAAGRGRWRAATAGVVVAAVAVQVTGQQAVLAHMVAAQHTSRREYAAISDRLHALGVRPPCALSGDEAPPLAYYAGCASMQVSGHDASTSLAGLLTAASTTRFAVVEWTSHRPGYTRTWHRYTFTTPAGHHWRIFVPAHPPASPRG
jgi:hypothetical protein